MNSFKREAFKILVSSCSGVCIYTVHVRCVSGKPFAACALLAHCPTALQDLDDTIALDPDNAGQFKVLTCTSTSCANRRQALGLDEYATFGAFYTRAAERAPPVQVDANTRRPPHPLLLQPLEPEWYISEYDLSPVGPQRPYCITSATSAGDKSK